jgi:hypothetical protein
MHASKQKNQSVQEDKDTRPSKYPFLGVKHLCPPSQTKLNATLKFGVGLQDMVKECHYAKIILMNTVIISKVDKKTLWVLQTIWIVIDLVS